MIFLHILIVLALLVVVISLVLGALNMRKTDAAARLKANKLMRLRIIAQLVAVICLVVLLVLKSKGY